MGYFFSETHSKNLTKEEFAEYERQAIAGLIDALKGWAARALDSVPTEAREWFKVPDMKPPDWYDTAHSHLLLGELHRVFCTIPTSFPAWIPFTEEQEQAREVLMSIGRAVRATRGLDPEKALKLLGAGIGVGHCVTRAHVKPFEPLAESGEKVKMGGKAGNIKAYGTTGQKQQRWDSYRTAVIAKRESSPHLSLTEARRRVAKELGVSYNTICTYSKM